MSPLDALIIINELNQFGVPHDTSLKVNGDEFLTPLDALLVINHLNQLGGSPPANQLEPDSEQAELESIASGFV